MDKWKALVVLNSVWLLVLTGCFLSGRRGPASTATPHGLVLNSQSGQKGFELDASGDGMHLRLAGAGGKLLCYGDLAFRGDVPFLILGAVSADGHPLAEYGGPLDALISAAKSAAASQSKGGASTK